MKENYTEKRFMELSQIAYNKWIDRYTDFLNIDELNEFSKIKNKLPSNYFITGGLENAERKLVIFSMLDFECINLSEFISFLKISPLDFKFGEILTHRNYLGAIMNLGIERSTIGDILTDGKIAYIVTETKIASYIKDNLKSVNKTFVNVEIIDSLPSNIKIKLKEILLSCASNRLDLIISKLFTISRKESSTLFEKKCIYVNDKLCQNSSYNLKYQDIVSVSGFGRFLFAGQESVTKKGNFLFLIKKYVS